MAWSKTFALTGRQYSYCLPLDVALGYVITLGFQPALLDVGAFYAIRYSCQKA